VDNLLAGREWRAAGDPNLLANKACPARVYKFILAAIFKKHFLRAPPSGRAIQFQALVIFPTPLNWLWLLIPSAVCVVLRGELTRQAL
jgi:hypothetical protein